MNLFLGSAGVLLGLSAAVLGAITLAYALVTKRRDLQWLAVPYTALIVLGAVLAIVAMERALITRDFTVKFVADNGSSRTPALYNVATLWSALEGSILLWALILSGYTAVVVAKFRRRLSDPLVGWAVLTMFVVAAFFFFLMAFPANPFQSFDPPPGFDGPGPNPLLQNHPLMAFHPPMLYLGYVGFTVPFAFAIAALATGRVGEGWLVATRRWTLFAWGFLTFGIVLGAWWSYEVLGWGGYWAWDPVENASLLPWLTGTAYLHSVMVQERRGMLRVWNLSLLCATFSLTILGTFITRSGVLDSVHAFTESAIGPSILAFFTLTVVVTVGLIGWRGDRLRAPGRIDSPLSREAAFLGNNVLFGLFAFVVLLGTVFPLLVEAINDDRVSVGTPYFNRMITPIALTLLFLMAVAPVLPWRKASGELLRQRLFWPACGRHRDDGGCALAGRPRFHPDAGVRVGRIRRRLSSSPTGLGHEAAGLARARGPGERRHDRAPGRHRHRRRVRGEPKRGASGRVHPHARTGGQLCRPHVDVRRHGGRTGFEQDRDESLGRDRRNRSLGTRAESVRVRQPDDRYPVGA